MFYSHEILTSRKYGVATVWLVATLGAKSNTKKVTRKAILDVDVRKACKTIAEPKAPMALRLQSNLLYGVAKVLWQKSEYLLADAQIAQNSMRALFKLVHRNGLDSNVSPARPDQIMLMDDPAFLLENVLAALPPLDFDFSLHNVAEESQRSSQSMFSIGRRSGSVSSNVSSVPNLNLSLPSSHGSYQLPLHDPFGGVAAEQPIGVYNDEEELILLDDDLFDFDINGQIRDIPPSEREARRAKSILPRDSDASGRVRREHEEAHMGRFPPIIDGERDFDIMNIVDDILPDAEAFPVMSGALGVSARPQHLDGEDHVFSPSEEQSSVFAEAKQSRKRVKKQKKLVVDKTIELCSSDLALWQNEYIDNMVTNNLAKANQKAGKQAKKNAFHFVFGTGINGVGDGIGSIKLVSPLAEFSGEALLANLIGIPPTINQTKNFKRTHPDDEEAEETTPNKVARTSELGRGVQNMNDDGMIYYMGDDQLAVHDQSASIEVGRDAPSALPDYPSSAMPWNISASAHSHQRAQSSSVHAPSKLAGSRRLTSASPLIGRGSALPGDLENFSQQLDEVLDDAMVMYGRSESLLGTGFDADGGGYTSSQAVIPNLQQDFEMYGPAAFVDTQTAANSQWVKSTLDKESNNFLEYVKNTIEEKQLDELSGEDEDTLAFADQPRNQEKGKEKSGIVTFEELFEPGKHSKIVASQAFYHILCLVTRGSVRVQQELEMGEDDDGDFVLKCLDIAISVC